MAEQVGVYVTNKFDQAIQEQPPVSHNGGRLRSVTDRMPSVDAAQNDTVFLARLPSNATIHAQSAVFFDDAGTGVNLVIGTFNARGTADVANNINTGIDISAAAGSANLMSAPVLNHGKALWELAGLTSDPGGEIDIKGTLQDADPGAFGMAWEIVYTID